MKFDTIIIIIINLFISTINQVPNFYLINCKEIKNFLIIIIY